MQRKAILNRILAAFRLLIEADSEVFEADVGERALTGNLARHMQTLFAGWTVDSEWDRRGRDTKKLNYGRGERRIVPDIVVHRRFRRENLIAIEIKKRRNRADARDHWKLRGLTRSSGDYGYSCGLYLVVDSRQRRIDRAIVYCDGRAERDLTAWFTKRLAAEQRLYL